jgi:hemerythrin-like domain-containing protein
MRRDPGLIPLSHDHQHALALCVLTRRTLGESAGPEVVARAAAEIVRFFDGEILDHFQFEEAVLFPILERYGDMAGLVAELKAEHLRIIGLVDALRDHGESAHVREFCSLLSEHVRKEETVLFERAQELMPPELLKEVGEKRVGGGRRGESG